MSSEKPKLKKQLSVNLYKDYRQMLTEETPHEYASPESEPEFFVETP